MRMREELAWAAGVFDGEGWASAARYRATTKGMTATLVLGVGQSNLELPERLFAVFGFGTVTGPTRSRKTPMWSFRAHGFEKVQAALAMMWPWLGTIKCEQLCRVLADAREHPTATKRYFTQQQAEEIRMRVANGERQYKLAHEFRCPRSAIWRVVHRRSYSPEAIRNVAD